MEDLITVINAAAVTILHYSVVIFGWTKKEFANVGRRTKNIIATNGWMHR